MKFAGARTPRLKLTMAKPANFAAVHCSELNRQNRSFVQQVGETHQ